MTGAEFKAAYAAGRRDFRGVDLRGADLYGADLYRVDLRGADLYCVDLRGADLTGADLYGTNLYGAVLYRADLSGVIGIRDGMPDARTLRLAVADHIENHPELHDQAAWGDGSANSACDTPCCVAGWACHLGGGMHGFGSVASAAYVLLWADDLPVVSFDASASREEILEALRAYDTLLEGDT